ncbi:hypothetical protein [Ignicoccus hospitalis]|uniref:hypothetical protein n=1 Tax=Ignicoccus hospitalis TaxID=160233 RepID=UPI0003224AD3|nr:hypothetical protein [Ignicoccus hospitalis]HIH90468.1 hypothetical protein [Desulfurococcaceae archaeon]
MEILKGVKKLVVKTELGGSAAEMCADVVYACSIGDLTFQQSKPYLVFHCAPPEEGRKIRAVEVKLEVLYTTTGEKKEFVLYIPKERITTVNGVAVKHVSAPGAACGQEASVLEDVVGYVDPEGGGGRHNTNLGRLRGPPKGLRTSLQRGWGSQVQRRGREAGALREGPSPRRAQGPILRGPRGAPR